MSQYDSMQSPGAYVPPNQVQSTQQQQPPLYRTSSNAAGFGPRSGGILGQMVNQHLTSGKPMLNKLGKSISSRLGNMPFGGNNGNTQQVQSYQGFQGHYGQANQTQSYQQSTGVIASPQPQHQQPQQQQQQQQPPQQWSQAQHPSPPPPSSPYQHAHASLYQQPGYFTAAPNHSGQPTYSPQTQQVPVSQSYTPPPPQQQQQTQQPPVSQSYTPPPNTTAGYYTQQHGHGGSVIEQGQTHGQQGHGQTGHSPYQTPEVQELPGSYAGQESGVVASAQNVPGMPNVAANAHAAMTGQSPQSPQSIWGSSSGITQNSSGPEQQPSSPMYASPHGAAQGAAVSQAQHHPHRSTPASPSAFAVELPADLGNLQLGSSKPCQVSAGSPNASASGESQTGKWRLADTATESPTDEFYVLADLLFDGLDAKFEPRNTGLVEGSKMLGSGLMKLSDEEKRVFSYQSGSAFAKMWSVEGIPHVMVPCDATLAPIWNFSKPAHGQHVRVSESSRQSQASYTPALNRAGWYKFLFVEAMRASESLGEAMASICADRYKAGADHPDLNKLDRTVDPALRARAGELRAYAIAQACEETRAAMGASG